MNVDAVLFDDGGNIDRARQKGWKGILYVDRDGFQKAMEEILPLKQRS